VASASAATYRFKSPQVPLYSCAPTKRPIPAKTAANCRAESAPPRVYTQMTIGTLGLGETTAMSPAASLPLFPVLSPITRENSVIGGPWRPLLLWRCVWSLLIMKRWVMGACVIGGSSFPLLLIPRRSRQTIVGAAFIAPCRITIYLSLVIYAIFVGTLGRGLRF
jgi:hypothetical protein